MSTSDSSNFSRKLWLDNIRWSVVILVMIFHVFFYFNNIGTAAIFSGAPAYSAGSAMRPEGIYQYAVYPWFMTLLFIVSGAASRYSIATRGIKEFKKSRIDKLLVPSTLAVLLFGWFPGYLVSSASGTFSFSYIPLPIKFIICLLSGTGALWFLQVLFIDSILLVILKKIFAKIKHSDKNSKISKEDISTVSESLDKLSSFKCCLLIVLVFPIQWFSSKLLNTPLIESYRFGIYITAFFIGYYIFSQDAIIRIIRKIRFASVAAAIVSGIIFIRNAYGTYYGHSLLLSSFQANLFTYFMILAIFGMYAEYFDHSNKFTSFCSKNSFFVYILHIPVMLVVLTLMSPTTIPYYGKCAILTACTFIITPLLGQILSKIPVLRYLLFGIRKY